MRYLLIFLIVLVFTGCSSTVQLPATLNVVPPSPDLPPEIAAFSGIWEGKWLGSVDFILVVEKVDKENAEILYSVVVNNGFDSNYLYLNVKIKDDKAIGWTKANGDEFIFEMDKGLEKMNGYLIEKKTGAKHWAYLHRRAVASSPSPLPSTLNIETPAPDTSPEVTAFVGTWEGRWSNTQDAFIIIEKIDNQKANLIFSRSCLARKDGSYDNYLASVLPGPKIEWRNDTKPSSNPDGKFQCPCRLTLEKTEDNDIIIAYWEYIDYKAKLRADLRRIK